jgi:hypothetical protein
MLDQDATGLDSLMIEANTSVEDPDDKNEKYRRTYRFSTTQMVMCSVMTVALMFGLFTSISKAQFAESQVNAQSLVLKQLTSEIAAIKALRREGKLTRKDGSHKWQKALGKVTLGEASARVSAIEHKAAKEVLDRATEAVAEAGTASQRLRARKDLVKAKHQVAFTTEKVETNKQVAKQAQALLKARTKQQGALRDLSTAPEGSNKKEESWRKLAKARMKTKKEAAKLTAVQTVKVTNKQLHEVTKVEQSVSDEVEAAAVVEQSVQKEEDAQGQVLEAEVKGVGRKKAKTKFNKRKQITLIARQVSGARKETGEAGRRAAKLLKNLEGKMTQLAHIQNKTEILTDDERKQATILEEEVDQLKSAANQAVISRIHAQVTAHDLWVDYKKQVVNATQENYVDAQVKAALAERAVGLNPELPQEAVSKLKEAVNYTAAQVLGMQTKFKDANQRLDKAQRYMVVLKQRLAHHQEAEEARVTQMKTDEAGAADDSESESEATSGHEPTRRRRRRKGTEGTIISHSI